MLNGSSSLASEPVVRIVDGITSEGAKFDRELRSCHREKISLPVDVICRDCEIFHGFTRNISHQGLCIVTSEQFDDSSPATICLYRLDEKPARLLAESRWSRKFGRRYWLSGWQFRGVPRT